MASFVLQTTNAAESLWSLILPYLTGSIFILFFGTKRLKGCVQMSLFQPSQQQSQHNQKSNFMDYITALHSHSLNVMSSYCLKAHNMEDCQLLTGQLSAKQRADLCEATSLN